MKKQPWRGRSLFCSINFLLALGTLISLAACSFRSGPKQAAKDHDIARCVHGFRFCLADTSCNIRAQCGSCESLSTVGGCHWEAIHDADAYLFSGLRWS